MGKLIYGIAPAIEIEDRGLRHLQVAIMTKLRRDENSLSAGATSRSLEKTWHSKREKGNTALCGSPAPRLSTSATTHTLPGPSTRRGSRPYSKLRTARAGCDSFPNPPHSKSSAAIAVFSLACRH
jgi:hypothetical protein